MPVQISLAKLVILPIKPFHHKPIPAAFVKLNQIINLQELIDLIKTKCS
jgi:hypothetical protein